jgi:hypothetical protein
MIINKIIRQPLELQLPIPPEMPNSEEFYALSAIAQIIKNYKVLWV